MIRKYAKVKKPKRQRKIPYSEKLKKRVLGERWDLFKKKLQGG